MRKIDVRVFLAPCLVLASAWLVGACTQVDGGEGGEAGPTCELASFPSPFSGEIPFDIDLDAKNAANLKFPCEQDCSVPSKGPPACLERVECTPACQSAWTGACTASPTDAERCSVAQWNRLHNIFSWQSFVGINWPLDGTPLWASWMNVKDVFLPNGMASGTQGLTHAGLSSPVAPPPLQALQNECQKGIVAPLWDQNGNEVIVDTLINPRMFGTIDDRSLYNLEGQINTSQKDIFYFPTGQYPRLGNPGYPAAIAVKLAWKAIDESKGDIKDRFFTRDTQVALPDGSTAVRTLGLVGMHIAQKEQSSTQWIWSTFEQVDNVKVEPEDVERYARMGKRLRPSFNNPDCTGCQANQTVCEATSTGTGTSTQTCRTQLERVIPLEASTQELNGQVQRMFEAEGRVWQYYRLLGTQWAIAPSLKGCNGVPNTRYISNPVLEPFAQRSSCVDCHSKAPMATGGSWDAPASLTTQPIADFMWVLSKAYWKKPSSP